MFGLLYWDDCPCQLCMAPPSLQEHGMTHAEQVYADAIYPTFITYYCVLQTYEYPQLKEDLKADVCVIGAGMDGLSIAYQLAKAGKSVIVLEGRSRGSGQTGR